MSDESGMTQFKCWFVYTFAWSVTIFRVFYVIQIYCVTVESIGKTTLFDWKKWYN